jgi:hypothetical protein
MSRQLTLEYPFPRTYEVEQLADPMSLVAYGPDGLIWRTGRLALDDLQIDHIEGDVLQVRGFFGGRLDPFTVELADGRPSGQPFNPP